MGVTAGSFTSLMISDSERDLLAGHGLKEKAHLSACKLQFMFSVLMKTGPTDTATASLKNELFLDSGLDTVKLTLTEPAMTELLPVELLAAQSGVLAE